MEIEGLAAIVTGGGAGLGEATVRRLAAKGARVAILDRNSGAGEALAKDVGCFFAQADITDEQAVGEAIAAAEARNGIARLLVNCAGMARRTRLVDENGQLHSVEAFRATVEVNLVGPFIAMTRFLARLAAAEPIAEERGVIINTASVSAFDGMMGNAAYSASKAGLVGMTLPAARDLAEFAVRVMTIAPGTFLTPMLMAQPESRRDWLAAQTLHPRRLGRPEEFALLVESIVLNPMLNAEVIRLDGGTRKNFRG